MKYFKFYSTLLLIAFGYQVCCSQDSLNTNQLKDISYSFSIVDGKLIGEGAGFLDKELRNAQYTLLGEFHNSKNISELTEALIPNLHQAGYRHMVLEVGPNTGKFLNNLPENKDKVVQELNDINKKYNRLYDGETEPSIPFFRSVEDARFLGEAKELDWEVIGVDQEYISGFYMQMDWMYNNLSPEDQEENAAIHQTALQTIDVMYDKWNSEHTPFSAAVLNSKLLNEYFQLMKETPENAELVNALLESAEIYDLNNQRRWYENNATRVKYMKKTLRTGLETSEFDISRDKMLVKMGGYHMSQGFSPLALFEVGNTLNELAEYHGNTAINIGFMNRFDATEGGVVDALTEDNLWVKNHENFISLGKKNDWVVIDLRPMRGGFYFHPVKYILNKWEEKIIQRFDLLIITPTEYPSSNNY